MERFHESDLRVIGPKELLLKTYTRLADIIPKEQAPEGIVRYIPLRLIDPYVDEDDSWNSFHPNGATNHVNQQLKKWREECGGQEFSTKKVRRGNSYIWVIEEEGFVDFTWFMINSTSNNKRRYKYKIRLSV